MIKFARFMLAAFVAVSACSFAVAEDKPADKPKYKAGGCCDKAEKAGKKCEHPCCVKAAEKGEVCQKCNKEKAGKGA